MSADGEVACVLWEGVTPHTAAQLLTPTASAEERTALDEAMDVLRDVLADGPLQAKDVQRAARDAGISEITLRRAKSKLGVTATREGFGSAGRWVWSLSIGDLTCSPATIDAHPSDVSTYDNPEHVWSANGTERSL